MDFFKKQTGVTMIALTITIIVLLIVTSITLVNMQSSLKDKKLDRLYGDISAIQSKLDNYYIQYKELPLKGEYCNKTELSTILTNKGVNSSDIKLNSSDGDKYYVIDLSKLENLTLNYGNDYKEWNSGTDLTNLYIINETSHQIYYPKGIEVDNKVYYYYQLYTEDVSFINNIDFDGITISANIQTDYTVATYGTVNLMANISIFSESKDVNKYKYQYSWNSTNTENLETFIDFELGDSNNIQIDSNKVGKGSYYLWVKLIDEYGNENINCLNTENPIIVNETIIHIIAEKMSKVESSKINNGKTEVYIEYNSLYFNNCLYGQGETIEKSKTNLSSIEDNIIMYEEENNIETYKLDADLGKYLYVQLEDNSNNNVESAYIFLNEPMTLKISSESSVITLNNCVKDNNVQDYKIYGNSIQAGNPTPQNPIKIQSVGDLVTDTTDENYGKYQIPITMSGKNLLLEDKLIKENKINNGISWTYDQQTNTYIANGTQIAQLSSYELFFTNDSLLQKLKLKNGHTYKLVNCAENSFDSGERYYAFASIKRQDNTNTYVSSDSSNNSFTYLDTDLSINFDLRVYSSDAILRKIENATFKPMLIDITQFQEATDEYEPYKEPVITNIYLDEPLRKIDDYADYIDFKEGKLVRKIYEYKFTGEEYYKDYSMYKGNINVQPYEILQNKNDILREIKEKKYFKALCSHFNRNYGNSKDELILANEYSSNNSNLAFVDVKTNWNLISDYTGASGDLTTSYVLEFKKKFQDDYKNGTPVTLQYILEYPKEEEIKLPNLNNLSQNIAYEIQTIISPSKIEMEYKVNVDS